jgi:hypothetical protein
MSDPVNNYLKAAREFDEADAKVNRYRDLVGEVYTGLSHHRHEFSFSNIGEIGLPPEAIMGRGATSSNARHWPTAADIQTSLQEWHKAKNAVVQAWSAIDPNDRRRLTAPNIPR